MLPPIPIMIGRIKEYFRDRGLGVRHPEELRKHRVAVAAAVEGFRRRSSRSPTLGAIAEAAGLSEEEVFDSFEPGCAFASSISDESGVVQDARSWVYDPAHLLICIPKTTRGASQDEVSTLREGK